ncbi:helix-turn-helix domain-containing protein [Actinoplanes sp. NPDC026670]|uniref:helix-turn-helix domain-containing protein n=1 Tax=Actinoplanes sp. NPDC026670 TaxID=3154700 RepID=UPI0033EA36AD
MPDSDPKTRLKLLIRDAMNQRGWSPATLAKKSGLSASTVSEALNTAKGVPGTSTIDALCDALCAGPEERRRLQTELVDLRNQAAAATPAAATPAVAGRPVADWNPQVLGVHPAVAAGRNVTSELPPFVTRGHDTQLRDALVAATRRDRHHLLVLIGGSSTGKSRSALEAVRACLPDHPVVAPLDAGELRDTLRDWSAHQRPMVLWLNEMQRFLDSPEAALELRRWLTRQSRSVALGTLWPDYFYDLTSVVAQDHDGRRDSRELLNSAEVIVVPDTFEETADLANLREAARHDDRLAEAAKAPRGQVIQALSGGLTLVDWYERVLEPRCRALVSAAMDAHWLGFTGPLPPTYLEAAAGTYLTGPQRVAEPTWFAEAIGRAAATVNGVAALTPTRSAPDLGPADGYLLADYLAQHGRAARAAGPVPAQASQALVDHLVPAADRSAAARRAQDRGFFRFAEQLLLATGPVGGDDLLLLARLLERRGDVAGAEAALRAALGAGHILAMSELIKLLNGHGRPEDAITVLREHAERDDRGAMLDLGATLWRRGRAPEAERWLRTLIDLGDQAPSHPPSIDLIWTGALYEMALLLERTGRAGDADAMLRQAAREGCGDAIRLLEERHPDDAVQRLKEDWLAGAEAEDWNAMRQLCFGLAEAGDKEGSAYWLRRGAVAGDLEAMVDLARELRGEGRVEEAKDWLRKAVEGWNHPYIGCMLPLLETPPKPPGWRIESNCLTTATTALEELSEIIEAEGDIEAVEALWQAMDEFGYGSALRHRALLLGRLGRCQEAEQLVHARFEDEDSVGPLFVLADLFRETGRPEAAEEPLREAALRGNSYALDKLIKLLDELGRGDEGEQLRRHGL